MATLKGKNFRILTYDDTAAKYKVIGMATNCVVTLTNNTENADHKDVIGLSSMPTVTTKGFSVSVDSLNVVDFASLLTVIKSMAKVTLMWDETSTDDNQTPEGAAFARSGQAYLSDLTLQCDDRTNSTKALQFTGTGPLETVSSIEISEVTPAAFTKGQFVRLFLSSDNTAAPAAVIAAARTLSFHVSLTLEDATTKDTTGDWVVQEPTELSYDISTSALVRSGDTITSQVAAKGLADLETIYQAGTPVKWKLANTSGANNRTAGSTIASGSVVLTQLTINGPLGTADYTAQMNGYGPFNVGS